MNRRKIVGLIGAAIAWPFAARAEDWERDRVYRLGFLLPTPRQAPVVAALFDELRVNGLIEGQNLLVIGDGFSVAYDQLPRQ
jgi:putative tryptophan/tyrosine transport system substrate-binding protein